MYTCVYLHAYGGAELDSEERGIGCGGGNLREGEGHGRHRNLCTGQLGIFNALVHYYYSSLSVHW